MLKVNVSPAPSILGDLILVEGDVVACAPCDGAVPPLLRVSVTYIAVESVCYWGR